MILCIILIFLLFFFAISKYAVIATVIMWGLLVAAVVGIIYLIKKIGKFIINAVKGEYDYEDYFKS